MLSKHSVRMKILIHDDGCLDKQMDERLYCCIPTVNAHFVLLLEQIVICNNVNATYLDTLVEISLVDSTQIQTCYFMFFCIVSVLMTTMFSVILVFSIIPKV